MQYQGMHKKLFTFYGLALLLQLSVIVYLIALGLKTGIIGLLVLLAISTVARMFVKPRTARKHALVFLPQGDQLMIKGTFKKQVLPQNQIQSLCASKNLFARIFDLSLVTITTPTQTIRIYCREINNPEEAWQA